MRKFLLVLMITILASSCGKPENDGKLKIITSFYPIYLNAVNIVQDVEGIELVNLTSPQTGCLHDYQLTPKDMKTLETADVLIVNGLGMENFLEKVIKINPNLKIIDASNSPEIVPIIENGIPNPHVWTSVTYSIQQVKNISTRLCEIDPVHAELYKKNALTYADKLTNLRDNMHLSLDMLPNKNIVTFHEAFPYLAAEFKFNIIAVVEREPGSEPTPQELADTIEKIKALPVKTLFIEPQYSSKASDTIAHETSAQIFVLDPVVTGESTPKNSLDYIHRMWNNTKVLAEALR